MDAYIGTICIFGFNFAPYQWALCQGQILPISSNAALFSLLGTTYGGNGTSTFGLPNLQGKSAIHMGQLSGGSLYTMGEFSGVDNVTILTSNMPAHSHTTTYALKCDSTGSSSPNSQNNYNGNTTGKPYAAAASGGTVMGSFGATLGNQGGSAPITISDPTLVMNYCIALFGIFPTRN